MQDYNKDLQKVITGEVKENKKGVLKKFTSTFFSNNFHTAVDATMERVISPNIKQTIAESITNVIYSMLFGSNSTPANGNYYNRNNSIWGSNVSTFRYSGQNINYSGVSNPNKSVQYDIPSYNELTFSDRIDAEKVLDEMGEIIDRFSQVSIADLYQLVGLPTVSTQNNYGWKSLKGADVVSVRGGYLIKLPGAILLK